MSTTAKYEPQAEQWTEKAYADPHRYLARRAEVVVELGPRLRSGDTVLDLACGDGGFAEHLLGYGLRYVGVDASEAMVDAARRRLGGRVEVHHSDLNGFRPAHPVAATTCFRAIYYARDRARFFRQVAAFTEKKFVFDLNPRQYRLEDVRSDLRAAGFERIELRPFFAPQRVASRTFSAALGTLERLDPLARLALRFRFSYLIAAARS